MSAACTPLPSVRSVAAACALTHARCCRLLVALLGDVFDVYVVLPAAAGGQLVIVVRSNQYKIVCDFFIQSNHACYATTCTVALVIISEQQNDVHG